MRAQLLHLSGPRRGRTDTPRGTPVVVGSAAGADVRFPPGSAVAPRHAEIAFDDCGCEFLIRAIDGDVFVDHQQVEEVILRPGDLIEFGAGGPKARFRVWARRGAACKPVRKMLGDAAAVRRESGVVASGGALVRDLLTQATWTLKVGFPLLLLGLVGVAFASGWIGGGRVAQGAVQGELEALREELAELRMRQLEPVTRAEVDAIRTELAERSAELARLASARAVVRTVLERDIRAVCLVHGTWGLRLPEPLRAPGREFVQEAPGKRAELEYTGSGFHVGADRIVTNRHVARPWEVVDEVADMLKGGFEPVMFALTVTFPHHAPVPVDPASTVVRAADRIDVAVFSADVPDDVPALELDARAEPELTGETVLVVGYPTGVGALLAKADEAVSRRIVETSGDVLGVIVQGLADADAISPIVTRGVLGQVAGAKLVYDADTTSGGSGGPVIGANGKVVGVNFAILSDFTGSNFGVPVRYVRDLLR